MVRKKGEVFLHGKMVRSFKDIMIAILKMEKEECIILKEK
jgi:hypothetical protein